MPPIDPSQYRDLWRLVGAVPPDNPRTHPVLWVFHNGCPGCAQAFAPAELLFGADDCTTVRMLGAC